MVEHTNGDLAIKDLIQHISWCLSQYSGAGEGEGAFHPDMSSLRTLQNNLHYFFGHPDSEQASAVAAIVDYLIDKVFSDLCAETPWDRDQVINEAWKKTLKSLLQLLESYKLSLEQSNTNTDQELWRAFREFQKEYEDILLVVNEKDESSLTNLYEDA
jgi:hypothetical protein